jgi:holo-[acyl-carrier-protein] synthase
MIVGIGTDILDIARMEKAYVRHGERLALRLLTLAERQQCGPNELIRFLAKRFAAKEAFSKALGTGIISPMSWQAVSFLRGPQGKPVCITHTQALKAKLNAMAVQQIHVSITDEKAYAVAFVVFETEIITAIGE